MSEIEAVIKRLMKYCERANKEVTQSIERRKLVMDIEMIYSGLIEIMEQRDAALKLADLWEAQAIKYPLENATSLVSPYTAEAVAVAQAAVKACAKELRAIYADKEQA